MSDYLSLKKYFIQELNIKAPIPNHIGGTLTGELSTDLSFGKQKETDNIFMVTLKFSATHKEVPDYTINATITGIFQIGPKCTNEEMRDQLLSNGAASTLYGILREIIRSATAQTLYPPMIIPIIHFEGAKISFADE
jgi:preprotein translocase subunit SecB